MNALIAFTLYLVVGIVFILMLLCIWVKVTVHLEDTCSWKYCRRRKQKKVEKIFIKQMLYPEPDEPEPVLFGPAPPSEDNVRSNVIIEQYIYRDAHITGLTGPRLMENLTLTVGYPREGSPSDPDVTSAAQTQVMRPSPYSSNLVPVPIRRVLTSMENPVDCPERIGTNSGGTATVPVSVAIDLESLEVGNVPPDYSNVVGSRPVTTEEEQPQPPPSYLECIIKSKEAGLSGGKENHGTESCISNLSKTFS